VRVVYLWVLVPLGLGLIISLKIPVLDYFRFLFVLPAFYIIVSLGLLNLSLRRQKIFLILVIFLNLGFSSFYFLSPKAQREDWREAVKYIENNRSSGSAVIFPADSQKEAYQYYSPETDILSSEAVKKGYSEVWLLRYAQAISDPTDSTRQKIENLGYKKEIELDFNGVVVWKYYLPD